MCKLTPQTLLSLLISAGVLFLAGCSGGGSPQADAFLNDYEKHVAKWEAKVKAGPLSTADFQELSQESQANVTKMLELGKQNKWSKAQSERLKALSARHKLNVENLRSSIPVPPMPPRAR